MLYQNYPNPFTSVTHISFYLSRADRIKLSVVDIHGREVEVIYHGFKGPGAHIIEYHPDKLPHGLYYCKLETPSGVITRKMVKL